MSVTVTATRSLVGLAGLLAALALSAGVAEAQSGVVIDPASGEGIAGASIAWRPALQAEARGRIEVDADGAFEVPERWPSSGWLEVSALGRQTRIVSWADLEDAGWRVELNADPLELGAVVVTASGREQRLVEVAVPVEQVSLEEIRATGAPSAERLLAEIPGLQLTGSAPNGTNLMIRGIGDSRVLVLVDGQPIGGALIEDRDLSRMSLAGVERVEVVKGPLSSLYGSDALGGVINLVTRVPDPGFRLDARALSGGFGRREADATVSGGDALRYRVTGAWRQQDEAPGIDATTGVFARVWDLRSSVRWDHGNDGRGLRLRSDASFLRERQRWPVGGGFSGFNDNRGVTGWVEAVQSVAGGDLTVQLYGQDYRHLYRQARGDAPLEGGEEEQQEEQLLRATVGWAVTAGDHRIDVGLQGWSRSITSPDKLLEDQASDDQLELYVQDAWTLQRTTLSAGLRATANDRWGNALSPSLGISTLPTDALRLRASMGRGFRAPSFKELAWDFANFGAGYSIQGNADLDPESSWNFTGGVDWSPAPAFGLTVEGYHNRINGLIDFAFSGSTPRGLLIYATRNLNRARTQGIEAEASFSRNDWRLRVDYALLDAEDLATGLSLDRRARHSGRLRADTRLGFAGGLHLGMSAHFTGDAPIIGTGDDGTAAEIGVQERLVSLDFHTTFETTRGLHLIAGVRNLLDARPDGWPAINGRRLRIGLEARDLF